MVGELFRRDEQELPALRAAGADGTRIIWMSTILNATDVTVRYGERAILDAATLAIEEGQRIGLVGRNGCGKTTFLHILAGLQSPDTGEVTRRRDLVVSYLPQDFMLDPAFDVRGNVRAGAKTRSRSDRGI